MFITLSLSFLKVQCTKHCMVSVIKIYYEPTSRDLNNLSFYIQQPIGTLTSLVVVPSHTFSFIFSNKEKGSSNRIIILYRSLNKIKIPSIA